LPFVASFPQQTWPAAQSALSSHGTVRPMHVGNEVLWQANELPLQPLFPVTQQVCVPTVQ